MITLCQPKCKISTTKVFLKTPCNIGTESLHESLQKVHSLSEIEQMNISITVQMVYPLPEAEVAKYRKPKTGNSGSGILPLERGPEGEGPKPGPSGPKPGPSGVKHGLRSFVVAFVQLLMLLPPHLRVLPFL